MALVISPTNGLEFHSAIIADVNTQRFSDVLAQTRLNLDPDENITFIYDSAPAYQSPVDPGQKTALKKLPPYVVRSSTL